MIGASRPGHRRQEFIELLRLIDRQTPTSSSWLNLVERWFREITDKRIRRGTFHNVKQLIAAIKAYIEGHNENPRSFTWTAKAETILVKIRRARAVLDKMQTG